MDQFGILYYLKHFPKLSESFILNEITELERRGYDVAVFAQYDPGETILHEELEELAVPVYYSNISYGDFPQLLSRECLQMASASPGFLNPSILSPKQIGTTLLRGKECSEFIENLSFEIDVIATHFVYPAGIGAIHAGRYHDLPCVVTAHATEIFRNPNVEQIRRICDENTHVIAPSKYNREYLHRKTNVSNDITVVPATTKVEKFTPSGNPVENRLLTVGRLVEKKGHKYAIDAVARLIERGYDIEYHIVGTGNREERLRHQVREHDVEDSVEFLGHVSDERLQREFNEAMIFVLPCVIATDGDRDAMPVALKEAMAAETVCVSTTVSAIPELITSGKDGELVPPRDPEQLTARLQELLDDPEQRETLAKNGRDTVTSQFDISNSVDTLVEVFDQCR